MSHIRLQCKLGMVLVVGWKCGAAFLLQSPQNHSMRNFVLRNLSDAQKPSRKRRLGMPGGFLFGGSFAEIHRDPASFTLQQQRVAERSTEDIGAHPVLPPFVRNQKGRGFIVTGRNTASRG